jgi:primosomal protein N' (replication factor Y)
MPTNLAFALNGPQVSGLFHYHLPPELEGQVREGHLVLAPFGRQIVQGVVIEFTGQPDIAETRGVLELVDAQVVLTPAQITLARQMAHDWLAPLAACIGLMLPPGLGQQADVLYSPIATAKVDLTPAQKRLLDLLQQRGPLRGQQIERAMARFDWRSAARALGRRGLVATQPVLPAPKVRPKVSRTAQLSCSPQDALAALPTLGRAGSQALQRRQAILRFLIAEPGPVDVAWIYAESGGTWEDLQALRTRGLIGLGESQVWRDPLGQRTFPLNEAPPMTREQQGVWQILVQSLGQAASGAAPAPILLHGVTGSGKTEIYLQAVRQVLESGRQAIVLVPEIALTPQTLQRFAGRFPGQVGLIHSGLSAGERYDTWRRARAGDLRLVVGPRSALFTPFEQLGLIVIDECHDDSYYQSEAAPNYHTVSAAIQYARQVGAVCLLGSATPAVADVYRSQQEGWQYLHLPERILAHHQAVQAQMARLQTQVKNRTPHYHPLESLAVASDLPPVITVDMREELKAGNRSIFSHALQAALNEVLEHKQQAILFLNRRGSATYVFCRDCGESLKCPRCEIPLTYHQDQDSLLCHHCSYRRGMPATCPVCKSARIRHFGAGTQRVEAEVQALFPQARTLRWDYETTRKKGAHEMILNHFAAQRADLLVGTQMLAKGLDLPLVTLVGVVLADVGLGLPDYRAGERTFQVLTQVAGRAGRSPLGGQVILQTFQPENYVIRAAAGHDYRSFYRQEIANRRKLGYPPFGELLRLEYRHFDAEKAERAAGEMASRLQKWLEEGGRRSTRLIGPAPCFFARQAGQYCWQMILIGPDPVSIIRGRELGDWKVEVNPPSLL